MDKGFIIFQENGLFGAKNSKGEIIISPQYMEMYPFSCGLSLVRNNKYQYAYVDCLNRQIVPFGKYIWGDSQFICNYARVKLLDNTNWGIIDVLGRIVVYPNLDYIVPLESFKTWGNYRAVEIRGRYKGENVRYIIDPLSRVNLPIDFEFMPDFDLDEYISPKETAPIRSKNFYTSDNSYNYDEYSSREDFENWKDQWLDAFEGDENNYWNIE